MRECWNADMLALEAGAERCEGSSPSSRTNYVEVVQLARHAGLKIQYIRNITGSNPVFDTNLEKEKNMIKGGNIF